MSQNETTVTAWLARLKTEGSCASRMLWQRYVERLVRVARRKLGGSPRRMADEEDVALSAFNAFLRGVDEGRFARLDDRNDLWQVLVMLTERKAIGVRRREATIKRGGGQVRGESVFAGREVDGSDPPGLNQAVDPKPSPAFAAELTDQANELLECLDDTQRRVALGKLAGYTNQELADDIGISLRAVERKLNIIRRKWDAEST